MKVKSDHHAENGVGALLRFSPQLWDSTAIMCSWLPLLFQTIPLKQPGPTSWEVATNPAAYSPVIRPCSWMYMQTRMDGLIRGSKDEYLFFQKEAMLHCDSSFQHLYGLGPFLTLNTFCASKSLRFCF